MKAIDIISRLRSLDMKLWRDGDRLRYSAPDGVMTTALRAELAEHKAEILAFLRRAEAAVKPAAPAILPVARNGDAPLSFAQQRLWVLDQLAPGSPLYNIAQAVQLKGALNVTALEQTLNEIVRRHEILRATIEAVDGKPAQVIATTLRLALPIVDLQEFPEAEREAEARRLAANEAGRPFDLSQGPLLRATLLRLGRERHVVLFTMSHIVSDGWSMGVLAQEVGTLYEAVADGRPSPLPELPIQYADFAHWQRQWLQGETLEAQLSYWKRRLGGAPTSLALPRDRPRPAVQTFRGAHQPLALSETLSESLKELSRRKGVTLFMTLLAAFKTLLFRHTGQEDIIVGTPIAGRTHAELEGLIGFFVNTLVLRADLSGDPSFGELLGRVREAVLEAFAHQDIPFEKLVDELQPPRDHNRTPWVSAAFVLQNDSTSSLEFPGLTLSPLKVESAAAKTDLILSMSERPASLKGSFDYNPDLFDAATIARMAGHFQTMLESIAADPEQRISMLAPSPGQMLSPVKPACADELDRLYAGSNLTRNQLLIWTGQKLQPDAPLYNMVHTFTISGRIDPERFQKAFQTLVNSSDALGSVIEEIDGIPQQRVIANSHYTSEYLDFSQASDLQAALQAWMTERSQIPFDLAKRLFDTALIKMSDQEFLWYLNVHHMIADGWSHSLIFRRVSEFYEGSLKGELEEKAPLPSFQDYVDYEREYRKAPRFRQVESYWKRKLAEAIEPIAFYGKSSLKQTTRVHRVSCDLGFERSQKLRALAVEKDIFVMTADTSLFNLFAALLLTYLYRVSGNRSLSLGIPFHNRDSKAFKETIGLFMEVCPLHITIEDGDTFLSVIKKVTVETFETLQHRYYFITNPHSNKAYDVILNYHTASFPSFDGASVKAKWVHSGHENDSLALQVHNLGPTGSFVLDFDFHCDVFETGERDQAIRHFLRVLDALLEDRARVLDRVSLLSAEEERRVLIEYNRTEEAFPEDQTIAQLFETEAEKRPDKLAAVYEGQSLTYAELNGRANQLAHHLRALGVGPEVRVGLCMKRSLEMVVGLLGILKAGGAYVPLDPAYPEERLAFMLADTEAPVLVTQRELVERLGIEDRGSRIEQTTRSSIRNPRSSILDPRSSIRNPVVVCLDDEWEIIARQSARNPVQRTMSGNLAYVIYTSGSTGRPKGVLVTNRAVVNHNVSVVKRFGLQSSDRILQFHSISFDAAVEELFPTWLSGATLVLRGDEMLTAGTDFLRLIEREELTVLDLPTTYWHEWVSELSRSQEDMPATLRLVIVGGEKASAERLALWQKLGGGSMRWINTYGPTETTVIATLYEPALSGEEEIRSEAPIGRPISNTQSYVLDCKQRPVPVGVPGELCIGGAGLARGYLNRPETTAEKFIPNPFILPGMDGSRLYRTGDLVRYLPDGNIEYMGRIDHQVKVRGFRIELGEVESALSGHPAVQETVVLAREDTNGNKRLVAYLVPKSEVAPPINELRGFLQDKLPEYMAPTAYVWLDALPLTPNGKVDRRALPEPDQARPELANHFVAPRDRKEEILAEIWAQVIGVERVGVYDNFFELGGDSMKSIQVVARANRAGFHFTPAQLFQHPTIANLVRAAGASEPTRAEQGVVTGPVPLTPIQRSFFDGQLVDPHHWNWAFLRETPQALNPALLEQTIKRLLVHHDALRLRFHHSESGWRQFNASLDESAPFTSIDLSQLGRKERVVALEAAAAALQGGFNLSEGPLLRVAHFTMGRKQADRALLIFHHLVVDMVSSHILMEDFQTIYQQLSLGEDVKLPPKTTSFREWALRLSEHAQSSELKQELSYWAESLSGEIPSLPLDYPATVNTEASTKTVLTLFSAEETRALLQEMPAVTGGRMQEFLLTALIQSWARWTGQRRLLVDVEGHGREYILEDVDLSRTVGWFTSMYPVLLDLGRAVEPGEALRNIQAQLRGVPNRGIGYGLLRYLCDDEEVRTRISARPRAEVNFNYLGQLDQQGADRRAPTPFRQARENKGPERSLRGVRSYLLYVVGSVRGGRLRMHWNYSANLHTRSAIKRLAASFDEELRRLIARAREG